MSERIGLLVLMSMLGALAQALDGPARLPDPVSESVPAGVPVSTASMPRAVRRAVVADAAKRFNVAEHAVVLAEAEQVTWSDSSLGCPEPGHMYGQALVPGYRVTARTQAGQLQYHTDTGGRVVAGCGQGRFQPGPKTLPAKPQGSDAEPRTNPPVKTNPDR